MPKVTVIIPAYNASMFIDKCVKSVLNQTEAAIEILIINDGSTDDTALKVQTHANADARIKFVNNSKNQGNAKTRNQAIEMASGEYVLFVDADDWVEPDLVEVALASAVQSKHDLVLFGHTEHITYINNPKENTEIHIPCLSEADTKDSVFRSFLLIHKGVLIQPWVYLYKRTFLLENNIKFDESGIFFEDVIFSTKSIYYANGVSCVAKSLYRYIRHKKSITHSHSRKSIESRFAALNGVKQFLKDEAIYETYKDEYTLMFLRFGFVLSAYDYMKLDSSQKDPELKRFMKSLMKSDVLKDLDVTALRLPSDEHRGKKALSYAQLNHVTSSLYNNFRFYQFYYKLRVAVYEFKDKLLYPKRLSI